jgi:hypothetical protein
MYVYDYENEILPTINCFLQVNALILGCPGLPLLVGYACVCVDTYLTEMWFCHYLQNYNLMDVGLRSWAWERFNV